ncbi:alkaline phosphatase family protein [Paraglaciecola aestuariivivens]
MSSTKAPLVVLAIDGLDWQILQQGIDKGIMPFCQKLIENGASGRLNTPPPHSNAAVWSTIATGLLADQHGICHGLTIREEGLTAQSVSARSLKAPTFWQTAMQAGKKVKVAGWPASSNSTILANAQGSCIVAQGVEKAHPIGDHCWPLAPELVSPIADRETILSLLVHPTDLDSQMLQPLLPANSNSLELSQLTAGLLAEITSLHNIGTHWAEHSDWALLAVKFSFLPTLVSTYAKQNADLHALMQPWYQYVDLMIGRYMALAGPAANLIIVSDHGVPLHQDCDFEHLFARQSAGTIIACGPDIPQDILLPDSSGLDLCPSILGLLELPIPSTMTGKSLFKDIKPCADNPDSSVSSLSLSDLLIQPKIDNASLAWLREHGYQPAVIDPLMPIVNKVKAEIMAGWAAVKYAKGNQSEAINVLQKALEIQPNNLNWRISLANQLLESGQIEACRKLCEGFPAAAKEGDWPHVINSLIAFANKNWQVAEQHLLKLVDSATSPINAYGWLGHTKFAQQQWLAASQAYQAALQGKGELAGFYEGLGQAHLKLENLEKALQAFSSAIVQHPFNAQYLLNRAQVYLQTQQLDLAHQDVLQALKIKPDLTQAHSLLAKITTL